MSSSRSRGSPAQRTTYMCVAQRDVRADACATSHGDRSRNSRECRKPPHPEQQARRITLQNSYRIDREPRRARPPRRPPHGALTLRYAVCNASRQVSLHRGGQLTASTKIEIRTRQLAMRHIDPTCECESTRVAASRRESRRVANLSIDWDRAQPHPQRDCPQLPLPILAACLAPDWSTSA